MAGFGLQFFSCCGYVLNCCCLSCGPGPRGFWPRSVGRLDLVWPIFGRGLILGAGPGPQSVPLRYLCGIVPGPGPRGKK